MRPSEYRDEDAEAVLARVLEAAAALPAQGWVTVRRENDGSLTALLRLGCRGWKGRREP